MTWGFAKKVIIKSQRQFKYGSNFYESDVVTYYHRIYSTYITKVCKSCKNDRHDRTFDWGDILIHRKGSKLLSARCTFCTEAVAQRLSDKNAVSMKIWTDWLCYLKASKIFSLFLFLGQCYSLEVKTDENYAPAFLSLIFMASAGVFGKIHRFLKTSQQLWEETY